jgi:hypothetical protein
MANLNRRAERHEQEFSASFFQKEQLPSLHPRLLYIPPSLHPRLPYTPAAPGLF